MPTNISITDNNLVLLYRYEDFDSVNVLDNRSESPIYTGLNTMSISGVNLQKISGPPEAPNSSGVQITGVSTVFHLPAPNQSGNASGVTVETTSQFTWGGWFRVNNNWTNQRAMFANFAFGDQMRRYMIEASSGSKFEWRIRTGQTDGTSTVTVTAADAIEAGEWMHVVGSIDGSTSTNNIKIYVSGILVGTGSATFDPGNSSSGNHPGLRLGAGWSATSENLVNNISSSSGSLAETFFMDRLLSNDEVSGVYLSGFQPSPSTGVFQSDLNDTLKDTIGPQSISASEIRLTAWDANNGADPSGIRHMTSGYHPAWIENISTGGSGLNFGRINQHTASGIKAITFRNITPETAINNIRFWLPDITAFAGVTGWEVSEHVDFLWLPNLTLPSGSGVVGKVLEDATTILQSDGSATISGATLDGVSISGESGISQYIYLSFVTNENFVPDIYGPTGFGFRLTMDNE